MNYSKNDTILKLEDVSLNFGDKKVLRDINIEIHDIVIPGKHTGQVTTILGKSGIGKSQLFKIIAGLMKPTTGRVLIGTEQKDVCPGQVGMVLQNYPLFKHRTLIKNLELVSNDKEMIEIYMNEFDIYDHKDKYPSQLSGGQRQRTAIVQQLLCSDKFILLDEPFSGLDPVATDKLVSNIRKIVDMHDHNTVLISSHVLEPSIAISDSVWILGNQYTEEHNIDMTKPNVRAKVEGATILYNEDLAAQGLAWNPEIRKDPRFTSLIENIRQTFHTI